jgi:hypothetical protein
VAIDFKNQQLQMASENYYARLRQHYTVEIDQAALAAAKAKAGENAHPAGNGVEGGRPPDLD